METLPTEIIGVIMSYLEKSDLLTSRLVDSSWNEECKKEMQKYKGEFIQTLTETNISQYLDFVSDPECFLRKARFPFHLNIKFHPVNPPNEPDADDRNMIALTNLRLSVDSLCTIFGKRCINKLTLKTTGVSITSKLTFEKLWLIDLLIKVSPGIEVLDLSGYGLAIADNPELRIKLKPVKFPQLETLICYKYDKLEFRWMREQLRTSFIVRFIVGRSRNLKHLEQVDLGSMMKLTIRYKKLRTLLIEGDLTTQAPILEKFRELKFPALQILTIKLYYTYDNYNVYDWITTIILELASATLKSLTIAVKVNDDSVNSQISRTMLMAFPRLPKLCHLRLDSNAENDQLIFLDPISTNFSPDSFPSLRYMELPLGYVFTDKSSLPEEMGIQFKFPKVKELFVRLHSSEPGALKHLQKIFPSVSKLSIVNECIKANKQCVRHLLQHLIQSPWSKNIKQFEIIGFEEDFLGQVLGQLERNEHRKGVQAGADGTFILSNVRKIRLGLPAETHNVCRSDNPSSHLFLPVPNLTGIAKYFPTIQIIEISEILFRGMSEQNRKSVIQTWASKFPYLWIHVLKEYSRSYRPFSLVSANFKPVPKKPPSV